jgi:hypothetical protein
LAASTAIDNINFETQDKFSPPDMTNSQLADNTNPLSDITDSQLADCSNPSLASPSTDTSLNTPSSPAIQVFPSLISVHPSELYIDLPPIPVALQPSDSSLLNIHPMIT